MNKEERKIDEREEIKIDDYTPENVSGGRTGNKNVSKRQSKIDYCIYFSSRISFNGYTSSTLWSNIGSNSN